MTSVPPPPPPPPAEPPTSPEGPPPQQTYATLPAQQYYGQPQYQKTNTLALLSMIFSIAGAFIFPVVGSIAGVVMGHLGRKQIRQTGESGDGMAVAGLIVGYVFGALYIGIVVVWLIMVFVLVAASSTYAL